MEKESVLNYIEALRARMGGEAVSCVENGDRVEIEGYGSSAEILLDRDTVLCPEDGVFTALPQGLYLRDAEYVLDGCRAQTDAHGRMKRINRRAGTDLQGEDCWLDTLGLQFGGEGWNAFGISDVTAGVVRALGSVLKAESRGSRIVHRIDMCYPSPLATRPCSLRFRAKVIRHGRIDYSQDITVSNI